MKICPVCHWKAPNHTGYCTDCEPVAAELHRAHELTELAALVKTLTPSERDEYRVALDKLTERYA